VRLGLPSGAPRSHFYATTRHVGAFTRRRFRRVIRLSFPDNDIWPNWGKHFEVSDQVSILIGGTRLAAPVGASGSPVPRG
jgi:hypothetical protein